MNKWLRDCRNKAISGHKKQYKRNKVFKSYLTTKTGKQVQTKDIINVKRKVNHEKLNGRTQGEVLSDMLNQLVYKDPNSTTILQSD